MHTRGSSNVRVVAVSKLCADAGSFALHAKCDTSSSKSFKHVSWSKGGRQLSMYSVLKYALQPRKTTNGV